MAEPYIQTAFIAGEVSPSLYGRTDLARFHIGAATMRNFFVNYKGGASSRAGTQFIGQCMQAGTDMPPRDIPFQFNVLQGAALEFGNNYMRVKVDGAYVTDAPVAITGISNSDPAIVTAPLHGYSAGDWVYIAGAGGMPEINGQIYIVDNPTTNTVQLKRTRDGTNVDSSTYGVYTSGGTIASIFTLPTPYVSADLQYMKFTQSADVMSICCLNQETGTEYPPYDLKRLAANNWVLTETTFASSIVAPISSSATASTTTASLSTSYQYVVTAVSLTSSDESIASPVASVTQSVNIATVAGSISVSWSTVTGAGSYNIYKAPPAYNTSVPAGALFGYAGSALGIQFVDNNITADFTRVPPLATNPFARGAITGVTPLTFGTSYTASPALTITTTAGFGAVIVPVVLNGGVQAYIVQNGGQGYSSSDTLTLSGGTTGSVATASLNIGPAKGTYPGCVAYFQQRRVYSNTQNQPDTYFMSRPGAFSNFDSSIPTTENDAITGTPWSQQVNGIQAMVNMPGGLVVLTGLGAWQVGGGSQTTPITPSNQQAIPQAYNGCHQHLQPIAINYDILYIQQKGSIVRDLAYNFFVNIYTGTDMTLISSHLFLGHQIVSWGWAEEPYKIVWCVRDDGVMLSFTFLKEQDIYGWARHDTNGLFENVCVISEGQVNAPYLITKRYVLGAQNADGSFGTWVYYSERMNDRLWENIEDVWCLDAALSYPMPQPDATLQATATGSPQFINAVAVIAPGASYTSGDTLTVIDPAGGSGATLGFTLDGNGGFATITIAAGGSGYTPGTTGIVVNTATGAGAVFNVEIATQMLFSATSGSPFTAGDVGAVLRLGGGIADVVTFNSATSVVGQIVQPITATVPNDPNNMPLPASAGSWSITQPTMVVNGLWHLEGMTVSIMADGSVQSPQVVTNGSVTLQHAASQILIGLPFTAQLQTLYCDIPAEATVQGRRKRIFAVTVRVESSRGAQVGQNQPDAATQPNQANLPWENMILVKERGPQIPAGQPIPLFTVDERINIAGTWDKPGKAAVQQVNPVPLNVSALIPEVVIGDSPG